MLKKTKFTIVLPTRDRSDTLVHTLSNLVLQEYEDFQILVSDNNSQDCTREIVQKFMDKYSNIKYINTNKRVSMSHNWEFALEHIDDGWVSFLGDDDGLLPGTLEYVDFLINGNSIQAIGCENCSFKWPSKINNESGSLRVVLKDGYDIVKSKTALNNVLNLGTPYSELPMIYRGFIDYDLIKKAKLVTNRFFLSMNPDVYSGIVFALMTDRYLYSSRPLFIDGQSVHSGGASYFSVTHKNSDYNPGLKFLSEKNIPFHDELPLLENGTVVKSIQALVFESYLQAKPFHLLKTITTTPSRQLYLILRDAPPNYLKSINVWGEKFSLLHNINLRDIQKRLNGFDYYLFHLKKKINGYLFYINYMYDIKGNQFINMKTVYEAGIIAAIIFQHKPKLSLRIKHLYHKLVS